MIALSKKTRMKKERPTDEELAELYENKTAKQIAELYGVSTRTVTTWVKEARERVTTEQLPSGITALKMNYGEKLSILMEVLTEDNKKLYLAVTTVPDDPNSRGRAVSFTNREEAEEYYNNNQKIKHRKQ